MLYTPNPCIDPPSHPSINLNSVRLIPSPPHPCIHPSINSPPHRSIVVAATAPTNTHILITVPRGFVRALPLSVVATPASTATFGASLSMLHVTPKVEAFVSWLMKNATLVTVSLPSVKSV